MGGWHLPGIRGLGLGFRETPDFLEVESKMFLTASFESKVFDSSFGVWE